MRFRERSLEPLRNALTGNTSGASSGGGEKSKKSKKDKSKPAPVAASVDENHNQTTAVRKVSKHEQDQQQQQQLTGGPDQEHYQETRTPTSTSSSASPQPSPNDATMVVGEKNKQPSTNTFMRQSTDSIGAVPPVQSTIQSHYSLSDSFWEIGQFKRSVKRIEDGVQACNQLMQMIRERADMESAHSKSLHQWSRKWHDLIDKGTEYGTLAQSWHACADEAEHQSLLHTRIRDRLMDEVVQTLKTWQKSAYTIRTLGGIKESRDADDEFRRMQKPWAKKHERVERAKKAFHAACKVERTAINQDKNAQGDSSVSADAQKKLGDRVERCREEREKTRAAYEACLADLNASNGKYMEDMIMVFEKCQRMEADRIKFFKEMLLNVHKCLDISNDAKFAQIYKEMCENISKTDEKADIKWWSQVHGAEMPMNWPVFEDFAEDLDIIYTTRHHSINATGHVINLRLSSPQYYKSDRRIGQSNKPKDYSPELRSINKKESSKSDVANAGGVLLLRQKPNANEQVVQGATPMVYQPTVNGRGSNTPPLATSVPLPPMDNRQSTMSTVVYGNDWGGSSTDASPAHATAMMAASTSSSRDDIVQTAYEGGSSVQPAIVAPSLSDDGTPGTPVIALYDYASHEEDELSLKKGDRFEKLDEPDEQGWCKGRLNGRVGLYPAKYAQPI